MTAKFFTLLLLMIFLVGTISAQEIPATSGNAPLNFNSWFKHTFGIQDFSVCGQDRNCDVYAKKTLTFTPTSTNKNILMDINVDSYCSSGYGLIDLFENDFAHPVYEFKDEMRYYCSSVSKCIVEVYCCPHGECSSDSNCESWEGSGSECKTSYKDDPYIEYEFSSYKYCTPKCSGSDITCWGDREGTCVSRTYDCGYETYPNCPTSYSYTSKSSCESSLPDQPTSLPGGSDTVGIIYVYKTTLKSDWQSKVSSVVNSAKIRIKTLTNQEIVPSYHSMKTNYDYPLDMTNFHWDNAKSLIQDLYNNPSFNTVYQNNEGIVIILQDSSGGSLSFDYKSPIFLDDNVIYGILTINKDILLTHEILHDYGLNDYCNCFGASDCGCTGIPPGCEHDIMADLYTPTNSLCTTSLNDLKTPLTKHPLSYFNINKNCILRDQLGTYIDSWIAGTITRDALGIKIQEWSGC
jgi:hypothetical protein